MFEFKLGKLTDTLSSEDNPKTNKNTKLMFLAGECRWPLIFHRGNQRPKILIQYNSDNRLSNKESRVVLHTGRYSHAH